MEGETSVTGEILKQPGRKESIIQESVLKPRTTTVEKETAGTRVEEFFLDFCKNRLESPEREGELPEKYSELDPEDFSDIVKLPDSMQNVDKKTETQQELTEEELKIQALFERIVGLRVREEAGEKLSQVEIEILRLADAVESVVNHSKKTAEVRNINDLENPLGEVGDVTLLMFADLHHVPSNPETQIREQAFKRYAPIRVVSKLVDKFAEGKVFSDIEGNILENTGGEKSPENVYKRYILREASLAQYRDWLERVIKSGIYDETSKAETQPLLISLGDVVHDGASLDAQLSERSALREILDATDNADTLLMEINGNHDNDSRVSESVTMLTELYGHGVFTQEVAGGVMVAAIDTNIENPVWVETFLSKTGETGKKLLEERRELQEKVKGKIRDYEGPVVLMGHNPSRIIEALSVKDNILQNSNVQRIIAGHTHKEDHVVLPFNNGKGEQIVMDVIESFVKVEGGKPQPPKLYALDIKKGKIGNVRTMHEPEDSFTKAVNIRL